MVCSDDAAGAKYLPPDAAGAKYLPPDAAGAKYLPSDIAGNAGTAAIRTELTGILFRWYNMCDFFLLKKKNSVNM